MTDTPPDQFPDKIFVKGHLTPMEKLMFANSVIAELKKEIGGLKSEIQHLAFELAKTKQNAHISRAENIEIRKDKTIVEMKARNKKLTKENQKLMKSNGELISKLYGDKLKQVSHISASPEFMSKPENVEMIVKMVDAVNKT